MTTTDYYDFSVVHKNPPLPYYISALPWKLILQLSFPEPVLSSVPVPVFVPFCSFVLVYPTSCTVLKPRPLHKNDVSFHVILLLCTYADAHNQVCVPMSLPKRLIKMHTGSFACPRKNVFGNLSHVIIKINQMVKQSPNRHHLFKLNNRREWVVDLSEFGWFSIEAYRMKSVQQTRVELCAFIGFLKHVQQCIPGHKSGEASFVTLSRCCLIHSSRMDESYKNFEKLSRSFQKV